MGKAELRHVFVTRHFLSSCSGRRYPQRKRAQLGEAVALLRAGERSNGLNTELLSHSRASHFRIFSSRLNRGDRILWTDEVHNAIVLRYVGSHDPAYSWLDRLRPVTASSLSAWPEPLGYRPASGEEKGAPIATPAIYRTDGALSFRDSAQTFDAPCTASLAFIDPPSIAESEVPLMEPDEDDSTVYAISELELQRLLCGDLESWMLFMPEAHRAFISQIFRGPSRVTGPSGSGKTALLLHRARFEAARSAAARVLVVCYNVALASVLTQLLNRLCASEPELRARIDVHHIDYFANELAGRPRMVADNAAKRRLLDSACRQALPRLLEQRFGDRLGEFLDYEIVTWIKSDPDTSYDSYRTRAFPTGLLALHREEREEVIRVAEAYEQLKGEALDWEDLRRKALDTMACNKKHPFEGVTAILVDEYQDLSTTSLKLVMEMAKPAGHNVFFCGDERQRIYCSKSNFLKLGIKVRGRSHILLGNYRNTRQIGRLAADLSRAMQVEDDEGTVAADRLALPDYDGRKPKLAGFAEQGKEFAWIADQITQQLAEGNHPGDITVLAPTWDLQGACAAALRMRKLPYFVLNGSSADRFFHPDAIKISTYHQAKGLEYKIVFCSGLASGNFKSEIRYQATDGQARLYSLLYMVITRGRDGLFLSFAGMPLRWLCKLDHALVELEADACDWIIRCQDVLERPAPVQQRLL